MDTAGATALSFPSTAATRVHALAANPDPATGRGGALAAVYDTDLGTFLLCVHGPAGDRLASVRFPTHAAGHARVTEVALLEGSVCIAGGAYAAALGLCGSSRSGGGGGGDGGAEQSKRALFVFCLETMRLVSVHE